MLCIYPFYSWHLLWEQRRRLKNVTISRTGPFMILIGVCFSRPDDS
jgi:hypothetical protein